MIQSSALHDVSVSFSDEFERGKAKTSQGFETDPKWQLAERDLIEIEQIRDDWDGLGAAAPTPKTVEYAFQFFDKLRRERKLPPPDSINASPRGRVVFTWRIRSTYIEAEIIDPTRISIFVEFPDGQSLSFDYPGHSNESVYVRSGTTLVGSPSLFTQFSHIDFTEVPQNILHVG